MSGDQDHEERWLDQETWQETIRRKRVACTCGCCVRKWIDSRGYFEGHHLASDIEWVNEDLFRIRQREP